MSSPSYVPSLSPTMMNMPTAMVMDDGMDMNMVMTFSDWDSYKIKILFDDWNCEKRWQFGLSCFAVVLFTVFYQWLKIYVMKLEKKMKTSGEDANYFSSEIATSNLYIGKTSDANGAPGKIVRFDMKMRLLHAFVAAIMYGFALILMLIAMTFNPVLFVCLMIGYGLGDLLFYPTMAAK